MDYTVAHYGILTQDPRLDVVLTFVDATDADKVEVWQVSTGNQVCIRITSMGSIWLGNIAVLEWS